MKRLTRQHCVVFVVVFLPYVTASLQWSHGLLISANFSSGHSYWLVVLQCFTEELRLVWPAEKQSIPGITGSLMSIGRVCGEHGLR